MHSADGFCDEIALTFEFSPFIIQFALCKFVHDVLFLVEFSLRGLRSRTSPPSLPDDEVFWELDASWELPIGESFAPPAPHDSDVEVLFETDSIHDLD